MKTTFSLASSIATAAFGVFAAASVFAADAPAAAPAGSTGLCKDGSYSTAADKKGACRGHKGVQDWYAAAPAAGAKPAAATPAPAAMPPASAPMKAATGGAMSPSATAAPGGGPGMVWANASSKVYHCSTDKWYGKTKNGSYMSESDAKTKGFHADHGKACA